MGAATMAPGGLVGAELQRDRRALRPSRASGRRSASATPSGASAGGSRRGCASTASSDQRSPAPRGLQHEPRTLAGAQREAGRRGGPVGAHAAGSRRARSPSRRRRVNRASCGPRQVDPVVERGRSRTPGGTPCGSRPRPRTTSTAPHQRARLQPERHEVGDLGDPARAEEAGQQDRGVRQVELLAGARDRRRDAEAAPDVGVEDRGEEARARRSGLGQNQSMEPSPPTSAAVRRSPISP